MIITCVSAKGGVGKTTTAIHLAYYFSMLGDTLLVDGDPNHSSLRWAKRALLLPFETATLLASGMKRSEHRIIDTPARPTRDDLEVLTETCDLLIIPTTPEILSIEATLETTAILKSVGCKKFKILLTMIPSAPRKTGQMAREALEHLPIFTQSVRRFAAYEVAPLMGTTVDKTKDRMGKIAWNEYKKVGQEITNV